MHHSRSAPTFRNPHRSIGLLACLLSLSLVSPYVRGQTSTWNLSGGGSWNDELAWTPVIPDGVGRHAVFDRRPNRASTIEFDQTTTLGELTLQAEQRLQLIPGVNGGAIEFDNRGNAARIRLLENAHLAVDVPIQTNADLAISLDSNAHLTFNAPIVSPANMSVPIAGNIHFRSANPGWTGLFEMDRNTTVRVFAAGGLGSSTSLEEDGTRLNVNSLLHFAPTVVTVMEPISANGSTVFLEDVTFAGPLTTRTSPVTLAGTSASRVTGPLSGAADLITRGTTLDTSDITLLGDLILDGDVDIVRDHQFTGTTIVRSGTTRVTAARGLGISSVAGSESIVERGGRLNLGINIADEVIQVRGGIVDVSAGVEYTGMVSLDGGELVGEGTWNGEVQLRNSTNAALNILRGIDLRGSLSGSATVVFAPEVNPPKTLTLASDNSYSGPRWNCCNRINIWVRRSLIMSMHRRRRVQSH